MNKLYHPTCGLEINLRRLKGRRRIRTLTMTEVTGITGGKGNNTVSVKLYYKFQHDTDLPFMAIVKRYGRAIPFRTLLETINRTHRKGV